MLGYLYQVRTALLWAVRESKASDFLVFLETLDDVSFQRDGEASKVLQTKHSVNSASTLSDLSPEVWKTLRIWMIGQASGEIPATAFKFLISTSPVIAGSACDALRIGDGRSTRLAAERLKYAAATSSNEALKPIFDGYLAMDTHAQQELLERVFVIPGQPNADAISEALHAELYFVSLHHQDLALEMLEGWWYQRVIRQLTLQDRGISKSEIESRISDIQESLKADSLPIDPEIDKLLVALEQMPEFASRPFYKQVELVGGSAQRIRNAITSYLQAFRQRSAWARNDLLFDADLQQYDRTLINEWSLLRAQVCDELGDNPGEEMLNQAGRAILKWAEDALVPIKPNVNTPWICRGSLHMLAEDLKVGWHPDFKNRMEAILSAIVVETDT
jgi:hypothetical protein